MRFVNWAVGGAATITASLLVASANADPARTVRGSVEGAEKGEPIWVGVFGDEAAEGDWTRATGRGFEVALLPGERATLLVVSKNRVPRTVRVTGASAADMALGLARGLALAGTVRSDDGSPLANAEITIEPAEGGDFTVPPRAVPRWRSDRRGGFQIGGLRPGRHSVTLTAAGHLALTLEDIQVREGADNGIEAQLLTAHFIAGRVVDDDGNPVAGVDVEADGRTSAYLLAAEMGEDGIHRLSQTKGRWTDIKTLTVKTAQDGTYRLGPFRLGEPVQVVARGAGLRGSEHHEIAAPWDGLVLKLRRRALVGRFVNAATQEPIRRLHVTLRREGNPEYWIETSDGSFEVPLDDWTRAVFIAADGHPLWFRSLLPREGDEYDLGEVALAPARTITGRVVDARTGAPIQGADVKRSDRPGDHPLWRQWVVNWIDTAVTDADGGFTLNAVPPETTPIIAAADGYRGEQIELPPHVKHIEFAMDLAEDRGPGAAVAGSLAWGDGRPAAGWVRLSWWSSGQGGEFPRRTEDGEFRFEGLLDGEYRLKAAADGGVVEERAVVVANGESVEGLRLVLKDGPRLRIELAGLPAAAPEALVRISDHKGTEVWDSRLGNGAHVLQGVPAEAVVTIGAQMGQASHRVRREIRVAEGEEPIIRVSFAGRARLSGIVTTQGRPLGGIDLRVLPADPERPRAYATTTRHGLYDVQGLAEGPHIVRTGAGHSFEVHVSQDTPFGIELPPISLAGVVRSARTRQPIPHSWVEIKRDDGYRKELVTGADGSFRFDGLAAGGHVVTVSGPGFERRSRNVTVAGREVVELELAEAESGSGFAGQERHEGQQ